MRRPSKSVSSNMARERERVHCIESHVHTSSLTHCITSILVIIIEDQSQARRAAIFVHLDLCSLHQPSLAELILQYLPCCAEWQLET